MAENTGFVNPRGRAFRMILSIYGTLVFLFLFSPIVVMVLMSFNSANVVGFPIVGITTRWYQVLFSNAIIVKALESSLAVAAWVTVLATIAGTMAAFPLVRSRLRYRAAVRVIVTLPIMVPGLLIGVAVLVLATNVLHIQPSMMLAVIGQTVLAIPFVVLVVSTRLETLDPNFERAARDLGASAVQRFRYVVLPLIAPGIVAAALMAFTLSLDEFVVTNFVIGPDQTLPIYIYNQLKFGITPEVNALATLMLCGTLLLIGLTTVALVAVRKLARRRRGSGGSAAQEVAVA